MSATGQQDVLDVLDILDSLEGLRDQLQALPSRPPFFISDFEMPSSSESEDDARGDDERVAKALQNLSAKAKASIDEDDDDDEDESEEEEVPPPVAKKKKKSRRRSGSDSGQDQPPKKKGRPPGSKNKNSKAKPAKAPASGRPPLPPNQDSGDKNSGEKKKRDPYMTVEEDYFLAKAYANTSENPIFGNNQKKEHFWQTIAQTYNRLAGEGLGELYVIRSWASLKNRWKRYIQPAMFQHIRFWREARNPKKSGWTEEMYVEKTNELFLEANGKEFPYDNIVEIIHSMPRFNPETADLEELETELVGASEIESGRVTPATGRSTPINEVGHVQGQNIERPVGNKKAKKAMYGEDFHRHAVRESVAVQKEHVTAIKDLNKATYDLSRTIREKSYQESDMHLAMLNYKMGRKKETEWHLEQAGIRATRWKKREDAEYAEEELEGGEAKEGDNAEVGETTAV
jgi:hypothetical protein